VVKGISPSDVGFVCCMSVFFFFLQWQPLLFMDHGLTALVVVALPAFAYPIYIVLMG
jgi:hypothetical protein